MAWKILEYPIVSACPLVMHAGVLVDPTNRFSKAMKLITSKRKKTDADLEELARLEFLGGLYLDEQGPILPSFVVEAALINGAKKSKEGMQAKAGIFCPEHMPLIYEGPRKPDEMWKDERFRFPMPVRVGQSKVMRMRPIFNNWSATIKVSYEDTIINESRVAEWVFSAGCQVGLCEWRPRLGRFDLAA